MRLTLSVGGWELPSGRHAEGCSAAVTDTAGESLPRVEKRGDAFASALLGLVLAEANISARDAAGNLEVVGYFPEQAVCWGLAFPNVKSGKMRQQVGAD